MGETRVDLVHLLQDLREAYPGSIEETIVTEMVANALDSGASVIEIFTDSTEPSLTLVDNGVGMRRLLVRPNVVWFATSGLRPRFALTTSDRLVEVLKAAAHRGIS